MQVQEGLTFMDWTFPLTGLDLSYVWDPEMWLQLKQAVVWNDPEVFWNKLWDRISYSELGGCRYLRALRRHVC
jgi:cell division protease FtsH